MRDRNAVIGRFALVIASGILAVGCGSAAPTGTPGTPVVATGQPVPSDPVIALSAPAEVAAGATFQVGWTGKETSGDFFVIVPVGTATWTETADSPYVNATIGNPATLTAPKTPGAYEIWFLKGDLGTTQVVKARAPLTVKPLDVVPA